MHKKKNKIKNYKFTLCIFIEELASISETMKIIFIICVVLCVESFCQTAEDWKSIGIFYYSRYPKDEVDISKTSNLNGFNKDRSTKLLIHGYIADRNHIAMQPIRNAYLIKGTDNLLIADWRNVAKYFYNVPRKCVGQVGRILGKQLKNFMIKMNIDPLNVHVIGHSLGAHIAGNVGKYLDGKIGRITALDPAGVLFRERDKDAVMETDAVFVDGIHTAGDSLGEVITRSTVDFFPNRGFGNQPGCKALDLITGCKYIYFSGM